jgi:hypothetical protein
MNSYPSDLFHNNYIPFRNIKKASVEKNLKRRFLVKLKRRFPVLNDWGKSVNSIQNSEHLKFTKPELNKFSQGFDQIEECVFYYVNGVIQMATFPKSVN